MVVAKRARSFTYNIFIVDSVGLSPCAHDERIVVRNGRYDIDALLAESREVGNVAWQVRCAAGRGECTGERKEDDFLVGPFCAWLASEERKVARGIFVHVRALLTLGCIVDNWHSACFDVGVLGARGNPAELDILWEGVAELQSCFRHCELCVFVCEGLICCLFECVAA